MKSVQFGWIRGSVTLFLRLGSVDPLLEIEPGSVDPLLDFGVRIRWDP